LQQQEFIAMKRNRVLVGRTWKKIVKVLNKLVSGLLCK
jgi:hypothetical protein